MLGCFGHCVFMCLHLAAVMFGLVGLIVTIPAHLIFAVLARRKRKAAYASPFATAAQSPFATSSMQYTDFKWGRSKPTEKQFQYAIRLGIRPQNGWTKRVMSEAISGVVPAKPEQLKEIASLGGVLPRAISENEAAEVLDFLSTHTFRCPSCREDICSPGDKECPACGVRFKTVQIPIRLPDKIG